MSNLSKSQYHFFTDHLSILKRGLVEALADKITDNGVKSKHVDELAIKISIDRYTELSVIGGCLTLLDCDGYQYNIWEADLDSLIEILNS